MSMWYTLKKVSVYFLMIGVVSSSFGMQKREVVLNIIALSADFVEKMSKETSDYLHQQGQKKKNLSALQQAEIACMVLGVARLIRAGSLAAKVYFYKKDIETIQSANYFLGFKLLVTALTSFYYMQSNNSNISNKGHERWNGLLAVLCLVMKGCSWYVRERNHAGVLLKIDENVAMRSKNHSLFYKSLVLYGILWEYFDLISYMHCYMAFRVLNNPQLIEVRYMVPGEGKATCLVCQKTGTLGTECPVYRCCSGEKAKELCCYHEQCLKSSIMQGIVTCSLCEQPFTWRVKQDAWNQFLLSIRPWLLGLYCLMG